MFKAIKDWFFPPLEYRDNLRDLALYLPVGNLDALVAWCNKWIPYRRDLNEQGGFDPLQNYNGADLTIKAKAGDCESIAAVYSEVIRTWTGCESWHVFMLYADGKAHDVAVFTLPGGRQGWIDGQVHYGGYEAMYAYYKADGWYITDWWVVNDLGQATGELKT
jgi:hypothetical protein